MIKIKEAIICEGKYDKIRLSGIFDTVIITTDGFGIFKDPEKKALIRLLAERQGIVILTDSDGAGQLIRKYLEKLVPKDRVKNLYLPELQGKASRAENRPINYRGLRHIPNIAPASLVEVGAMRHAIFSISSCSFPMIRFSSRDM